MVCVRVGFHENDGNHENDESDEGTQTATNIQGVECWIRGNHGNHKNDENHGNPPRVPQTTGLVSSKTKGPGEEGAPEIIQKFRLRKWPISSADVPRTPMERTEHNFGADLEIAESRGATLSIPVGQRGGERSAAHSLEVTWRRIDELRGGIGQGRKTGNVQPSISWAGLTVRRFLMYSLHELGSYILRDTPKP